MPKRKTTLHHAEDHIVKDAATNFSGTPPKDVEQAVKEAIEFAVNHQALQNQAHEATAISTEDDGNYFTTNKVEGNLQEAGLALSKLSAVAYGAHTSGTQSIPTGTNARLVMNADDFDVGGHYDPATNYRWTPPSGTVFIQCNALLTTFNSSNTYNLRITKNGSDIISQDTFKVAGAFMVARNSIINIANGSDYYEIFVNNLGTAAILVNQSLVNTGVQGLSVRAP
jgi:hypothetical protein